jgi:putative thioredoxin
MNKKHMKKINYNISDFQKEVIEESCNIPVLVDFWAEWCGPCKVLGPVLERLAEIHKEQWKLAKLDTDKNQEIAAEYGIRGIPNVKLFINGEVVNEFAGALPEHMVEEWLKKAIPGKNSKLIIEARKMLEKGDEAKAKNILDNILEGSPAESEAKLLLSKIYLFKDTEKAVKLISDIDNTPETVDLIGSIQTISSLLTRLNNQDSFNDSAEKLKYIDAINDLKNKNFELSLEKFIDVIRNDRNLDDDGARKACLAIFKYLGEENEITLKHRRDFGGALYI